LSPGRGGFPERLVLATANAGKLRELEEILTSWNVDVRPLSEFTTAQAAETGLSFVENALIKARFAAGASGLPAIADDSGLEVDALNGAPGIHSARYAGAVATDADNNLKLLAELEGLPPARRGARYRCAMVFMRWPLDAAPLIAQAAWGGRILRAPAGVHGFGYDPIFEVDGSGRSAAQLDPPEKNRVSHRGQALRLLLLALQGTGRNG
jgi:XTP/dITP diphosphohydrolase